MTALWTRLTASTQSQLSSAVLWREAARTSRQWQTYATRMGFSGAMIGAMLLAIWGSVNAPFVDPANLAWLGRGLFIGVATIQFGLALMLAPLMSASALIEESESGTLDMLVLTRLTPSQIATAKVFSRVLMLLTVAFGAMPIMAAVVTLGGVSTVEVVTVTLHTGVGIVIAGAMGGLFSLFTRSPLLAMFAAAAYALPMYVAWPSLYALLLLDPSAFSHLSPLGGPVATSWAALAPVPAFIPVLWLIWRIGTDLFALRTSRAHIRHAFSAEVWRTKNFLIVLGVWVAMGVILVPGAGSIIWTLTAAKSTGMGLIYPAKFAAWLWCTVGLWLGTWMYLRLAVDIVDAVDRTFASPKRKKDASELKIWSNPVAWREARPRAWGASAVPIQFTWLIGLLLLSQSTLWMIPGGLVGLGLLNATAAVVLTLWLATWSIEIEKRDQSLELLLTTTMPAWKITVGKMLGIALPTLPLILLSLPMLAFGTPYAHLVFGDDSNVIKAFGMGIAAWVWVVPTWLASLGLGMVAGLRSKKRASFGIAMGITVFVLGVPAVAGRLFPDIAWLAVPSRLVAPALAGNAEWWQIGISVVGMSVLAVALLGSVTLNLRAWVSASVVMLLLGSPAFAQTQLEPQDDFVMVARPLADGLARPGQWTAVQVSVMNLGAAAEATLTIEERAPGDTLSVPWTRKVELPENARKDVTILVRPGNHSRDREVRLVTTLGRAAVAPFRLQLQGENAVTVGIIGNDALGINAIGDTWTGPVPGVRPSPPTDSPRTVRAGLLDPGVLPRHSAAYDALDHVVWHRADPSSIGARELDALLGWTAAGGHLTLTITDTWRQVSQSPLANALPLRLTGVDDAPGLNPLLAAMSLKPQAEISAPRAVGEMRTETDRGAWVMAASDDGTPLWTIGSYGLGTVTVLSADPAVEPLSLASRMNLWRNLLWLPQPTTDADVWAAHSARAFPTNGGLAGADRASLIAAQHRWIADEQQCFYNEGWQQIGGYQDDHGLDEWESHVRSRLSDIPGASPLPLSWLIAFSIVYLLVIGPVDFFVLRYLRKEPWTWVTFPVTVAIFSAIALAGTTFTKGSQAVVTRVELVDVLPGTDRWRGQTQIGVFATRKTQLSLRSGVPDGMMSPLRNAGFMNDVAVQTHTGPGALDYRAETWTLAYSRSTWITGGHGSVLLRDTEHGPEIENQLGLDLRDVVVISTDPWGMGGEHRYLHLGDMAAGETASLSEDANWTQQVPSDDIGWAKTAFYEHPEQQGGHLHPGSYRWTLLALADPIESVALTGLSPIPQDFTAIRAPLGVPIAPIAPSWNESNP